KLVEKVPEALRTEGHAGPKVGGAEPCRPRLAQVLLDHLRRRGRFEEPEVLGEGAALALESGGRDVEQGAAPDGDDGRVGADDVAVTGQRGDGRLEAGAAVGHVPT